MGDGASAASCSCTAHSSTIFSLGLVSHSFAKFIDLELPLPLPVRLEYDVLSHAWIEGTNIHPLASS